MERQVQWHTYNPGLIQNNISLTYNHMLWSGMEGCHASVGLNQKQYIIKGMTCGMDLYLVFKTYSLVPEK